MSDTYLQIAAPQVAEMKIKGSRFIGEAFLVMSEEEALSKLQSIRKREYNATHHCWAYRLGQEMKFRYSDDGEPGGTAGLPILRQIEGKTLTNVLVVVTRYYGGTKLGTGGLARAYGEAAGLVLNACQIVEHIVRELVHVRFAYADTALAMHTISCFDAKIETSSYSDETELVVSVRSSEVLAFKAQFTESLAGRGVLGSVI